MKTIRVEVVHLSGGVSWVEEWSKKGDETDTECAWRILDNFNRTLRPGEGARKIVRIVPEEETAA